jgi:hypothetical protein
VLGKHRIYRSVGIHHTSSGENFSTHFQRPIPKLSKVAPAISMAFRSTSGWWRGGNKGWMHAERAKLSRHVAVANCGRRLGRSYLPLTSDLGRGRSVLTRRTIGSTIADESQAGQAEQHHRPR